MKIATRSIIRDIDKKSIEKFGIPGLVLMENAGRATADVILAEYPYTQAAAVFAGGGNNGGDGFVIARQLISEGVQVVTYIATDPRKYTGDALTNYRALKKLGGEIVELNGSLRKYRTADIIVDALLGTGLEREVSGFYKKVIEFLNSQSAPVIAVDLPSGLDADTGQPLGAAVEADITVTYALPKIGTSVYPGVDYAGDVYLANITTPYILEENIPYELLSAYDVVEMLPPRNADTHKGTYGHLLVLAGSPGKSGAATLSSLGALRVGTGLVTVGVPSSLNPIMEQKTTEVMTEPLPETDLGTFGKPSVKRALEIASGKITALAVGPGITTGDDAAEFLFEIMKSADVPMVLDADALTLIGKDPAILKKAKVPLVLTPHPGEMARLSGLSTAQVQNDRIGVAMEFSKRYGVNLILKGARSIISTPTGEIFINTTGNPGMASGGTGDVLTGVVGGLLAQGLLPADACKLGAFVHGTAGDLVAEEIGEAGLTAGDLADALPEALSAIPESEEEPVIRIR
jgi:ADP-dependent NAD(P)H-hydrate dehydratase / NAD(P)H-hydrate epimerase